MLIALTRAVSSTLDQCALTHLPRRRIDVGRAAAQHRSYERCLEERGAALVRLPEQPALPDAVFVEDTAVVLDELAVMAPMGTPGRRAESASVAAVLARYRPLASLHGAAQLEGGDVVRIGERLLVGLSCRTNPEGLQQLGELLRPHGYEVRAIPVTGCLHLKTACTSLGQDTCLVNPAWVDPALLAGYRVIEVAEEEPWSANALVVGDRVLLPAGSPRTRDLLARAGFDVEELDISELAKAEAGLTCMSLLFSA